MAWKMYQTAAKHHSLENFDLDGEEIPAVLRLLQAHFQERLTMGNRAGIGLSSVGVDIRIDGTALTVGWDNWSGVFIMAWDADGDRIVSEIEHWLGGEETGRTKGS